MKSKDVNVKDLNNKMDQDIQRETDALFIKVVEAIVSGKSYYIKNGDVVYGTKPVELLKKKETMKVTIPTKTIEIKKCYHECPYFALDGGPGPVMFCDHPDIDTSKNTYAGFFISHPECDEGFPKECPLRKDQ